MVQLRIRSTGPPSESVTGWGRNQRQVFPTLPSLELFAEHWTVHCCSHALLCISCLLCSSQPPWWSYFYSCLKEKKIGGGGVGRGTKASDSKAFAGNARVLPTAPPRDLATELHLYWENKTQIELSCCRSLIRYIPFDVFEVCCHGC